MKLIQESALQYLSVKLPLLGAFLMLAVLVIQWALDFNFIPEQYAPFIIGTVLPALSWVGRKIAQPSLHQSLGFVAVTAGHSNTDPGAVSGKYKEAELVRQFRNAVAHYLAAAGLSYKTDGAGTINLPLTNAIALAKGASIAIEFHLNASANSQANGIETIALPKDKILAQKLSKAVADVFGSRLRGDKGWIDQSQSARGKLGFINAGGLIVELGFISNDAELAAFNSKYWSAAKSVAQVIIEHEKRA